MIVRGLSIDYLMPVRRRVVRNVDLEVKPGQIVGLVGESGCGKTTLARSLIGEPPRGAEVSGGEIDLSGTDLLGMERRELRRAWGDRVAYLSQDPSSSLNPTRRIGRQLEDTIRAHRDLRGAELKARVDEVLDLVDLARLERITNRYPRGLSGGQRQRVAIAAALACDPEVLILDEPTTGLDVSTQARMVTLIQGLIQRLQISVLWVSHDLALMSQIADKIAVMYAGEIIEEGSAVDVCFRPRHPYTRALLASTPSVTTAGVPRGIPGTLPLPAPIAECSFADRCPLAVAACRAGSIPLEEVSATHTVRCIRAAESDAVPDSPQLARRFEFREGEAAEATAMLDVTGIEYSYPGSTNGVHDVSFDLQRGEILGIVGESGSGKSTLLRLLTGLTAPAAGSVTLDGERLALDIADRAPSQKRRMQLIFQHSETALNPRHTVSQIIMRPLTLAAEEGPAPRKQDVVDLLDRVRLNSSIMDSYPSSLSGGQRQRLAIARSLAIGSDILLCDEITSALDVSVQAAILELLTKLAAESGISMIFVTHNLAAVHAICEKAIVMSAGRMIEHGPTTELLTAPQAAYTKQLIAATPVMGEPAGGAPV